MEDWIDVKYDGISWSCCIDDGSVVEICSPNGADYSNAFVPHIRDLIATQALAALNAKIADAKTEAAISRYESQIDEMKE